MMKKLLLLLPLVIGLSSCGGSKVPNQKVVNQFKELLNKQDLSDFTSKWFGTMFTQEYDVLDVFYDDDSEENGKTSSYYNYVALGFLDSYYDLTKEQYDQIVDEKGNVNVFDAIAVGEGGYRITQLAKTASFLRKGGLNSTFENLDIDQRMTLKSTLEDVIVYNVLDVTDNQIFEYSARQSFNGVINKELLLSSISTRSFREIFSQVNLFDSPGNIEYLDRLYFSICKDLKTKNDKEISQFIIDKQITFEEVDDRLELSFVFQETDMNEDYIDNIFPGEIKGTLSYDKNTGSFDEFHYEIKYLDEKYDEESGNVRTANMIFSCAGQSSRSPMGDMRTPDDPTIYDNAIEFLEKVSEEVIPPII